MSGRLFGNNCSLGLQYVSQSWRRKRRMKLSEIQRNVAFIMTTFSHCETIMKTVFTSICTQNSFNLRFATDFTSQNVIYQIESKRCNEEYVGQTKSTLINSQKCNIDIEGYATDVALHSYNIAEYSFLPIDVVIDEMIRLCKETYWIQRLKTLYPKGINSKLLFKVE